MVEPAEEPEVRMAMTEQRTCVLVPRSAEAEIIQAFKDAVDGKIVFIPAENLYEPAPSEVRVTLHEPLPWLSPGDGPNTRITEQVEVPGPLGIPTKQTKSRIVGCEWA